MGGIRPFFPGTFFSLPSKATKGRNCHMNREKRKALNGKGEGGTHFCAVCCSKGLFSCVVRQKKSGLRVFSPSLALHGRKKPLRYKKSLRAHTHAQPLLLWYALDRLPRGKGFVHLVRRG